MVGKFAAMEVEDEKEMGIEETQGSKGGGEKLVQLSPEECNFHPKSAPFVSNSIIFISKSITFI